MDVDFQVPAANMPTAPVLWSDPIKDELRWLDYLDSISAALPWKSLRSAARSCCRTRCA